jgi:hypothetical protein
VLEGAAVAGDPFEPELAAAAAATSEGEAMNAVDDFCSSASFDPPTCRALPLRHPLVRRAVYEATAARLATQRARAVQRRAGGARSRRSGAGAPCRALRTRRDADAVALLREAGAGAARLAPESAARWFGDAAAAAARARSGGRIELLLARSAR